MKWLIGMVTGNPLTLVWVILAAIAIGVASGGSAAWTIQGWRLDASKQEFTQYKLDRATQSNEDLIAAKAETKRLFNQLSEAQYAATKREQAIRSLSSDLADSRQRLRNDAGQITRGLPGYSPGAVRVAAETFAELFTECQGQYAAVAESADRHASDAEKLIESWPGAQLRRVDGGS